ncbi:ExbD/TolR family protein [Mucilaginibacter myungsuensis]|uniref:Biopolymer transporter ExbD n=1 Tax=Mucilaginibacter myungsuensis TaxID=649104 RepID=A0A929PVJ0_9SPHI|nr:biopolymer transporter ExbD [Mucilaginibacter myungsuensis]MBE9661833.1 biopolymer transporter ExbD [Mucilaginibacter myungsuensis]MDN3599733.1 biopolymer transporter ExbD [Mucilaginibacter myungsuensis]
MAELNQAPANSAGSNRKKHSTRADLTAMVDLAFLLVTFFMLTTTLSKPRSMDMTMPDDGPDRMSLRASQTVTLCLGKDDQLVFYRGEVDKPIDAPSVVGYDREGLRRTLLTTAAKIKQETGKDMIVVIKPSEKSLYHNLVNTIDELNITRTNRYAVVDISPQDIDLLKAKNLF